jgi:hypothetical protein
VVRSGNAPGTANFFFYSYIKNNTGTPASQPDFLFIVV